MTDSHGAFLISVSLGTGWGSPSNKSCVSWTLRASGFDENVRFKMKRHIIGLFIILFFIG